MSLRANLEAAIKEAAEYRRKKGKAIGKMLGITLDIPAFVESYERETDTLKVVSHYYKEDHRLQGVFFYQGGKYKGHQTRAYRSTVGMQTMQEKLEELQKRK